MQTIQQAYSPAYSSAQKKQSALSKFMAWCNGQERNRFGWVGGILAIHGCALTPVTLVTIAITSNNIVFWIMAISAMGMCLITNLAALPTKVTIPVFLFSVILDIGIIASTIASVL